MLYYERGTPVGGWYAVDASDIPEGPAEKSTYHEGPEVSTPQGEHEISTWPRANSWWSGARSPCTPAAGPPQTPAAGLSQPPEAGPSLPRCARLLPSQGGLSDTGSGSSAKKVEDKPEPKEGCTSRCEHFTRDASN